MVDSGSIEIVLFTIRVALVATLIVIPPGLLVSWLLARKGFRGKAVLETIVTLPLVMPPVATGLILLKLLGRRGPIGGFLHERFGIDVVFTATAVVIAMAVMSFPLFVRTMRVAFEGVNHRLEDVARTLGASEPRVFATVTLPLALPGLAGGAILAFARAIGEFGATIMVAGSIPGETETLAVSIFQLVQLGKDPEAFRLLLASVVIAFVAVLASEVLLRRHRRA